MTKDAYYFSHDSNARNDDKILELRAELGWEGYGLFWATIEILSDCSNYTYPSNGLAGLALTLNLPRDKLQLFLNTCFKLNLLIEKDGFFYSESLMKRMERVDAIRQRRVEAGRAGGLAKAKAEQSPSVAPANKGPAKAKEKQCSSNAKAKSSKERKVKESKVKENNVYPLSDTVTPVEDFDLFWNTYQKKVGKKKCQAFWKKLPEATKVKIRESLPAYVANTPDIKFRKDPLTWLNGEHWNDEPITKNDSSLKMVM